MANAAEAQIGVLTTQTNLMRLEIGALILTLAATAWAAWAASQAAIASVKSVNMARRGYVVIEHVGVANAQITSEDGQVERLFQIKPSWRNVGASPAMLSKAITRVRIRKPDDKTPIDWEKDLSAPDARIPLGPGMAVDNEPPVNLTFPIVERIFKGEINYYFMVEAHYSGMFEEKASYTSRFCFLVGAIAMPEVIFAQQSAAGYFSFLAIGEYTSAT